MRKSVASKVVKDISLEKGMTVENLISKMNEAGGFTAKKLAIATEILAKMVNDQQCTKFLSFPACIVATGTRGVLKDLVKEKLVDVVITTCGTLDHDLARCWRDYYHGDFLMNDADLHKKGINRLGNVLIPNESYGLILEKKLQPFLEEIWSSGKKTISTKELCWELGNRIENEESILYWAAKNKVPIYIPGIIDGMVGSQLWMFNQQYKEFNLDLFKDEQELADIVFTAKKTGALLIGGGISKHHTIWWNQFREGLNYAVYITTAEEYDGSLSGARPSEAVSWGKVRENAKYITVEGDATILLPLLVSAVLDRID